MRRILAAAVHAPSAHNQQPWRFVVARQGALRSRLAADMAERFRSDLRADGMAQEAIDLQVDRARRRLVEAPVAVIVCMTMEGTDVYPDERRSMAERTMAVQSAALAGGHILLAAEAEGLGACWLCGPLFVPEIVREGLSLPDSWEPQALILIGYVGRAPRLTNRRPADEVTQWR
ncbi:MAG: nitroreductase family protein [Actinobacteria bacterium]|nr:nitroreductase family protein [Actinomycetota bacterium]